ncbi:hypothetical protein [uncultured Nostoc sp.]
MPLVTTGRQSVGRVMPDLFAQRFRQEKELRLKPPQRSGFLWEKGS